MKTLLIVFVLVVLVFGGVLPFTRHAHLRTGLEADLRAILFEYNTSPRAKFLERAKVMCARSQVESEFEVELVDGSDGAFTLTVSYVDHIRLFFAFDKPTPVRIVLHGTRIAT